MIRKVFNLARNLLKKNRPYHAQWFLTRKCNYRCRSCSIWREQDEKELSTAEVLYGLEVLKDLGVMEITFTGGNPLLRKDIGEILRRSSKYFITTIYDNGSMVRKKIDALKYVDGVALSIESLDAKKQDYLKGVKGSLRKLLESAKTLKKEGIDFVFSLTISNLNLEEAPDIVRKLGGIGIPFNFSFYDFDPMDNNLFKIGRADEEFIIKDRTKAIKVLDELKEMSKEFPIVMPSRCFDDLKYYLQTGRRREKCKAFQKFLMIDHLGRISGCHLKEPVTTLYEVKDFWNSEKAERIRAEAELCNSCSYLCYFAYSLPIFSFIKPLIRSKISLRNLKGYSSPRACSNFKKR